MLFAPKQWRHVALLALVVLLGIAAPAHARDVITSNPAATRAAATEYIFGTPFPTERAGIKSNAKLPGFTGAPLISRVERLTTTVGRMGFTGYLLHPKVPSGRLLIFHFGHTDFYRNPVDRPTIDDFLGRGYTLLMIEMPLSPDNSAPMFTQAQIDTFGHELLRDYAVPLRYFMAPIAAMLNRALAQRRYVSVSMTGISGGGWATTVYSALDPRIESSYPVAGSLPLYLRIPGHLTEPGDFEQTDPGLYARANYLSLYALASLGRRQLQILNLHDPVCFDGIRYLDYDVVVQQAVTALGGGRFGVYLDTVNPNHLYTPTTVAVIDQDIRSR